MANIEGGPGPDDLPGTDDDDIIHGRGGDDEISGAGGDDVLYGDGGNDLLFGGAGTDDLYGGSGDDQLLALEGRDRLYGGNGADYFSAASQSHRTTFDAFGGKGDDFFFFGDLSDGSVDGGDDGGYDTLRLTWWASDAVTVTTSLATRTGMSLAISGIERFEITTLGGDDVITTGDVSDAIGVGAGANTVNAGGGDDTVSYVAGSVNVLDGGAGTGDTLEAAAAPGLPFLFTVTGATADDGFGSTITGFEHYRVTGGSGNDVILLGDGKDFAFGGDGNDEIRGGDGRDRLYGGDGDDVLRGGDNRDILRGEKGNDTLYGGDGDDTLGGGGGDDVLIGGRGDDIIYIDRGFNRMTGGDGADRFVCDNNQMDFNLITDFVSGEDRLELNANLLQFGPGAGPLDPARFNVGGAVGSQAQFVLYSTPGDPSGDVRLVWDPNGDDPAGGVYFIMGFSAGTTLTADDILII